MTIDLSSPIPDICEIVLYNEKPHRVTGWYKSVPEESNPPSNILEQIIFFSAEEDRKCREENGLVRIIPCERNVAEYVGIYAVAGYILKISEIERVGKYVEWKEEFIKEHIEYASRRALTKHPFPIEIRK